MNEEELRVLISYLEASSNELDQVIGDMSKVLRMKRDNGQLFETVSLRSVLDRTLLLLVDDIRGKKIRMDMADFRDESVHGSATYLQSIFYNLVENAVRYSDPQSQDAFVKITCNRHDRGVRVQIIDNGIGIDMTLAGAKMFQIYQHFNTHSSGRGLGLYLVKTQMEAMGGTVDIESALGVGTTFTLDFKVV